MKNMIWVTTQFEALHKYPNAPDDVAFLRNEHRHIIKAKVWIDVKHNDREIEFIMFKRFINSLINETNYNNKSLETISDDLHYNIINIYKDREVWIELSEDGENGSFKMYEVKE